MSLGHETTLWEVANTDGRERGRRRRRRKKKGARSELVRRDEIVLDDKNLP